MLLFALFVVVSAVITDYIHTVWKRAAPRRQLLAARTRGCSGEILRVSGWVDEIPHPLAAPFSGVACAAYRVAAKLDYPEPAAGIKRLHHAAENKLTEFWLSTTSGRVRVCGVHVELALPMNRCKPSELRRRAFAEGWRLSDENLPGLDEEREVAVVVGDLVSVLGLLREELAEPNRGSYREVTLELCLVESSEQEIVIGPVAPKEEAALRAAYARERTAARRGSHEP